MSDWTAERHAELGDCDQAVRGGQLCVKGTRFPVAQFIAELEHKSAEEFVDDFELPEHAKSLPQLLACAIPDMLAHIEQLEAKNSGLRSDARALIAENQRLRNALKDYGGGVANDLGSHCEIGIRSNTATSSARRSVVG